MIMRNSPSTRLCFQGWTCLVALVWTSCGPTPQTFRTDVEKLRLHGPVQQITQYAGEQPTVSYTFDRRGNIVEEVAYDPAGQVKEKWTYEYDEFNFQTYSAGFDAEGNRIDGHYPRQKIKRLVTESDDLETMNRAEGISISYDRDTYRNWTVRNEWKKVPLLHELDLMGKIKRKISYYKDAAEKVAEATQISEG